MFYYANVQSLLSYKIGCWGGLLKAITVIKARKKYSDTNIVFIFQIKIKESF